ncbi:MAG: hypothetical protein GDA36_01600 [Rhodobacteraceae bacterium]|nr:hypothetical protein [Paracoccaceae bacterium]
MTLAAACDVDGALVGQPGGDSGRDGRCPCLLWGVRCRVVVGSLSRLVGTIGLAPGRSMAEPARYEPVQTRATMVEAYKSRHAHRGTTPGAVHMSPLSPDAGVVLNHLTELPAPRHCHR